MIYFLLLIFVVFVVVVVLLLLFPVVLGIKLGCLFDVFFVCFLR